MRVGISLLSFFFINLILLENTMTQNVQVQEDVQTLLQEMGQTNQEEDLGTITEENLKDNKELQKRVEQIMFKLFINRHSKSMFIADIAGSVNIQYIPQRDKDDSIIAASDGAMLLLGSNLNHYDDNDIEYVVLHELYHIALLHASRRGNKELELWNQACDHVINNALDRDGYTTSLDVLKSSEYSDKSEEEVYKILYELAENNGQDGNNPGQGGSGQGGGQGNQGNQNSPNQSSSGGQNQGNGQGNQNSQGGSGNTGKLRPQDIPKDIDPRDQAKMQSIVSASLQSGHKAIGDMAGNMEQYIKSTSVKEKDWRTVLYEFMEDAFGEWDLDYTRPNKRFPDFFIPAWTEDSENIKSINFYIDTSGSVSDESVQKYISEIAYIKSLFKPDTLTISCFDTQIGRTQTFTQDDEIEKFNIVGRGGTHLACVKRDIEETKPVCAVIFSDMYCYPMEVPTHKCGVLWVQYDDEDNYADHEVLVGKKVHFKN